MAKMTLKIPKMAVSMQDGTIVEWYVKSGDSVALGQALYAIETEKTTSDVESPFAGVITILMEPGVNAKVGTPIAEIIT
jgi:pyruvate/2-oxoglutarate dehydrogenase complex dihydrolipoamide acyltransferase (E2) component